MSSGADLFVICKQCGSEVSPYITECPYCGSRLRKRAPKLERARRERERRERRPRPSLGRLRRGEIPGIAVERRPVATIALIVASLGLSVASIGGAVDFRDVVVRDELGDEWWRVLTAPFAYDAPGYGYIVCALAGVALFGWLLERRHGPVAVLLVFLVGGAGGMLAASALESVPLAAGANGAALALLCAWTVPDLQDRRRQLETDSDLLGVAVFAAVLLLLPVVIVVADPIAGLAGAVAGFVLGVPLAVLSRAR